MSRIRLERVGPIARIVLGAPPVNALNVTLLEELLGALGEARRDDAVRAVVIASALPRYFCAGLDLAALADDPLAKVRPLLDRLYTGLLDAQFALGKPSIAAVSGAARGGGMTIAVSCNVIVADETASFGYPEIDVGMPPAIHLAHLPRIVGRHSAYELLLTGRTFDAHEERRLGLVTRVARSSALDEAMALAETFAAKSPAALAAAHAAFMAENDHRASVQRAVNLFCANLDSDHAREGLCAFVQKRPPVWRG